MKIGLVAAMECEINGINEYITEKENHIIQKFNFISGKIDSCEIVSVCCGIGLINAALATQLLINHFSADCIINPGVAGALSKELDVCDVVVSKDATYCDFNPQQLINNFPFMEDKFFPADKILYDKCLVACNDIIHPNKMMLGRVVSGQRFIADLETKLRFHENMQADCVEMEGAAIAHACYLADVPYLIIRSISDTLNHNDENASIAFREFLSMASLQLTKVLEKLIRSL